MTWQQYAEKRATDVEWLGAIPADWSIRNPKHLFRLRREPAHPSDRQLTASQSQGVVYQDDYMEARGARVVQVIEGQAGLKHVGAGDFVISLRSFQGGIELCQAAGKISPAYTVLTPGPEVVERFFTYLLKSQGFIQELRSTSNQLRDGQSLGFEHFAQVSLPLPSADDQRAITRFLDRETAKTDALIGKQEQLIATLREDRAATITNAVTTGVTEYPKMKDSETAWLGQIPEHWEVIPLKRLLAQPITDGPHETPQFLDQGVEFISAEAVSTGVINFSKRRGFISEADNVRFSAKYSPKRHDIYVVKSGATTGVAAIVTEDRIFNIWSPLAALRCAEEIEPLFLLNAIRSDVFQKSIALSWNYGTQQNLGMATLANLLIAVPPREEQRVIARYLQEATGKIDNLIAKAGVMIGVLREYRSALITSAVTGEIDVRGAA